MFPIKIIKVIVYCPILIIKAPTLSGSSGSFWEIFLLRVLRSFGFWAVLGMVNIRVR